IVGCSRATDELRRRIALYAREQDPVLILGETGVGKELVARALHLCSGFADEPFVPIDCGALAPSLFESELFGHARGAFTGAAHARAGLLAEAATGTVFFDEIGELPLAQQAKLLRLLEESSYRRVGDEKLLPLQARVVAATNRDLRVE